MNTPYAKKKSFIMQPPPSVVNALPLNKTRAKRPLLHPPIPPPNSTLQKTIYISGKTPFISAVKRISANLDLAATRPSGKKQAFGNLGKNEVAGVLLKATGKAIDRALQLGVHFLVKGEYRVLVKTGSVNALDDVVDRPEEIPARKRRRRDTSKVTEDQIVGEAKDTSEDAEQLDMITRKTSMIEIHIMRVEKIA